MRRRHIFFLLPNLVPSSWDIKPRKWRGVCVCVCFPRELGGDGDMKHINPSMWCCRRCLLDFWLVPQRPCPGVSRLQTGGGWQSLSHKAGLALRYPSPGEMCACSAALNSWVMNVLPTSQFRVVAAATAAASDLCHHQKQVRCS